MFLQRIKLYSTFSDYHSTMVQDSLIPVQDYLCYEPVLSLKKIQSTTLSVKNCIIHACNTKTITKFLT